ncbi:MAG: thioesterase [Arcobacter sp.]|nr:thioesterase [Arcobacter sp.]
MRNKSFIQLKKVQNPSLRIICFHHAGGSAGAFNSWRKIFDPQVEIYSAQLPGRENRLGEPLCNNMKDVQYSLFNDFLKLPNLPFIFFGHSLGGFVAYELAKNLYLSKGLLPKHLIIASIGAPHMPPRVNNAYQLNDSKFIDEISKYGALPKEIVQDKEFKSLFLPIIKSDFNISEGYFYKEPFILDCNITSIVGDNDHSCFLVDSMGWKEYTSKKFHNVVFPGAHFFIKDNFNELIKLIQQIIDGELPK